MSQKLGASDYWVEDTDFSEYRQEEFLNTEYVLGEAGAKWGLKLQGFFLIRKNACVRANGEEAGRSHRRQPTRLPRPWDSPGKNTGVSCHFLLQCMKVKSENEVIQLCPTLHDSMDCSLPGSSIHGIFQARVPEWGAIAF